MRLLMMSVVFVVALGCIGCGSDHHARIHVADAATGRPVPGASVEVIRTSQYFLSLRARPEFPAVQEGATDEDGDFAVRLIDGDSFHIRATHPDSGSRAERILSPWRAAKSDDGNVVLLELSVDDSAAVHEAR